MEKLKFKEAVIEYQGVEYTIEEPTITLWNDLNQAREFQTEWEFGLSLICLMTGLSYEDILDCESENLKGIINNLSSWLLENEGKFYNEFEFKGKKYKFIDLNAIKFGEWIDLDFFLQKPITYRQKNLNELMSLLYREVDVETGKVMKYNSNETKKRSEVFKDLPIRYLRGSMVFFYNLETILYNPTPTYSINRKWLKIKTMVFKTIKISGGGIMRLYIYLMKTFSKWMKSPKNQYLKFLTF